jgi:hypothetical protein
MHQKVAERIADNLSAVRRRDGGKVAAEWWSQRFAKISEEDYYQVLKTLEGRKRKR